MNPAFDIGRQVGQNFGAVRRAAKDEDVIENILSQAIQTGDPAALQSSISKILSQVSPERQGPAIQHLQNTYNTIQQKQEKMRLETEGKGAAQQAGYTYGVPPQVAAQQVKDKAKSGRLSAYGIGVNNPGNPDSSNLPTAVDGTPQSLQGSANTQAQPQGSIFKRMSDEQLTLAQGSPDREISEPAKAEARFRESERNNERADIRERRKETQPLRQEIANKAAIAQQSIQEKENLIDLINTGKINDPTYAVFLESIPMKLGERFLSNETVQYKAGLVNGYRDLRNIFSGATRVKEIELLENKIADLYLTDDQKKAILKSSLQTLNYDLIRADVAAEVEEKFPGLGVLEFSKKVNQLAKPRLESLANRVIDEQKSYIKDAENRKKIPLDYDDPEGKQILQQILQEAGGDRTKARELAKKKGYIIGK